MLDLAGGGEISEDIGAAEGVDCLFRVADEEEGTARIRAEGAEDGVLHRIGILKFVDKDGAIGRLQRLQKTGAPRSLHCTGDFAEEIVEGAYIQLRLALLRFPFPPEEKVALQGKKTGAAERLQLLPRGGKVGAGAEEGV